MDTFTIAAAAITAALVVVLLMAAALIPFPSDRQARGDAAILVAVVGCLAIAVNLIVRAL